VKKNQQKRDKAAVFYLVHDFAKQFQFIPILSDEIPHWPEIWRINC
jgi:hypothetical protein